MNKTLLWLLEPPVTGNPSIVVIRILAGFVFFFEGILKFVYVNQGVGRFTKLGFPMPADIAHSIAVMEILGGILLIIGLFTRIVSLIFVIEMLVAIFSTKISLYLGTSPLPLPAVPPKVGFWAVVHEIRSEFAQLLSCLYLLIAGAGCWSVDFWLRTGGRVYKYVDLYASNEMQDK